jgi:acetyl esterase/lipase
LRIKLLLLASLFAFSGLSLAEAESTESPDVKTSFDVPYVTAVLDQKVESGQMLDIYLPAGAENPPVILYLHGGSWAFGDKKDVQEMPYFFALKGMAFVSMNYRLRWDYKVYDQVTDVVAALKWLAENGAEYGIDGSRVVVMGNSSGGHLASLAIADSSYMKAESFSGDNVKAVVSLGSISYDINRLMKELGSFIERQQHELIFGDSEKVWRAASPISHVANSTTLKPFALFYSPSNETSLIQAKAFAKSLTDADVPVIMIAGVGETPDSIDAEIATQGSVATGALLAFLRSQL